MAEDAHGYALRVDIAAEVDAVWRALTEPVVLRRWCAESARIDARDGGSYTLRLRNGALQREAHIDVCAPPRRLRLIYMPLSELGGEQPVLVDDFLLERVSELPSEPGRAGTVLRLLGSGFPDQPPWNGLYLHLRSFWEQALLGLKALLEADKAGEQRPTTT